MIATTDLRLCEFTEHHDEDGFVGAEVTVTHTESTREFTARVVRGDDGPALSRFDDSGETGFVRTAFPALWYCIEEFLTRDIHPDLGALTPPSQTTRQSRAGYETGGLAAEFDRVVEHDRKSSDDSTDDTDTDDTDSDTPSDADTEAPQPATAVTDGEARPATRRAPDAVTPHDDAVSADDYDHDYDEADVDTDDLVDACPECDGTGQVNERVTAPDDERWKCYACGTTFPEPNRRPRKDAGGDDDSDSLTCEACGYVAKSEGGLKTHQNINQCYRGPTPQWLSRNPHDILNDSQTTRNLHQVITAVRHADDVMGVMQRLALTDTDKTRGQVLQPMGLLTHNGQLINGDTLEERLEVLKEWIDDE